MLKLFKYNSGRKCVKQQHFFPLNIFFWIVTVTVTIVTAWVDISIPPPPPTNHVLFVTFNSTAWNIHNKSNHFICSEVLHPHLGPIQHTLKVWRLCRPNELLELLNKTKTAPLASKLAMTSTTLLIMWFRIPWVSQNVALTGVVVIPHWNAWLGVKGLTVCWKTSLSSSRKYHCLQLPLTLHVLNRTTQHTADHSLSHMVVLDQFIVTFFDHQESRVGALPVTRPSTAQQLCLQLQRFFEPVLQSQPQTVWQQKEINAHASFHSLMLPISYSTISISHFMNMISTSTQTPKRNQIKLLVHNFHTVCQPVKIWVCLLALKE